MNCRPGPRQLAACSPRPGRPRCAPPVARSPARRASIRSPRSHRELRGREGRDDDLVGGVVLKGVLDARERVDVHDLARPRSARPPRSSLNVRSSRSSASAAAAGSLPPCGRDDGEAVGRLACALLERLDQRAAADRLVRDHEHVLDRLVPEIDDHVLDRAAASTPRSARPDRGEASPSADRDASR